jgi:lipopolysaccharide export system permease protein
VFSVFALYVIFLVVSLLENLDEFINNDVPVLRIAEYYIYFFPGILEILLPVAMLISILFSVGKMAGNNEITAMKTGGMSLYRLMFPLVLVSLLVAAGHLYFNGWIVPEANERKIEIDRTDLKKISTTSSLYDLYLRNTPLENLTINSYSAVNKVGNRIRLETFDNNDSPRLERTIEANAMKWDSVAGNWKFRQVIERIFTDSGVKTFRRDSMSVDLTITHEDILTLVRTPDEMDFDENWEYIKFLEKGGKDIREQLIDYYGQYAYPFANIIVVLFGVPFASIKKKGGVAVQISAALVISFLYLIFTKLSLSLGSTLAIDPILMAWSANIIFFAIAIFIIYRTNT